MKRTVFIVLASLAVILVSACSQPAPAPKPTPTTAAPKTTAPTTAAPTAAPSPKPSPTTAWTPPRSVSIAATNTQSVGYAYSLSIADTLTQKTGINLKVQAAGTVMDRAKLARPKEVSFVSEVAGGAWAYQTGFGDMDLDGWGPQKARVVFLGGPLPQGFATQADSGIKAVADIKGKRLANFATYPTLQVYMDFLLAYAGLTWNDVKPVQLAGSTQAHDAIIAGTIDVTIMSQDIAKAIELESSPHGIYWIPLPASETANWKRGQATTPYLFPLSVTTGPGASVAKPAQIYGFVNYMLAYHWQDENLVYWFTKAKTENYDAYKDKQSYAKTCTLDNAVMIERSLLPYHPGAIKYYKEIGRWGEKEDKLQAAMLAKEAEFLSAWKAKHPTWKAVGE